MSKTEIIIILITYVILMAFVHKRSYRDGYEKGYKDGTEDNLSDN